MENTQKQLIKKLLREEIEEGKLARTLGTLGMAASTLASPSAYSMDKPLNKTEKIGVSKKEDGSIVSVAKTDGPTKEFAKELAITKAKNQLASSLNIYEDFDFEIVDIKFEKVKGKFFCTVQIALKH
jgi:ABC-type enterochelin transport system ATPase subunit